MDDFDNYAGLPLLEVYPFQVRRIAVDSVPFGPKAIHYITQEFTLSEERKI